MYNYNHNHNNHIKRTICANRFNRISKSNGSKFCENARALSCVFAFNSLFGCFLVIDCVVNDADKK